MTPVRFLHLEMLGFLYALAGVIAFQLLTGRINMVGLFSQKFGDRQMSPGRVQLLLATIALSSTYLTQVATTTNGQMPDVSSHWLYLFGGSSGIYALEKAWNVWNASKKQNS
jgi:hypothetical protein